MPRLLPRLLQKISLEKDSIKCFPFSRPPKRTSRYKPLPPRPSFQPAHHPTSILFSPTPNPVTTPREYDLRKSMPPLPRLPPNPAKSSVKYNHDAPREMTVEERAWWSSPYLRMLASPVRQCFVTERHLPADFLIRLGAVRVMSSSKPQATVVPDGLQHTKFAPRRSPRALYVSCHRKAIMELFNRPNIRRIVQYPTLYPNLPEYIADMLRARVLQELELHCDQLPFKPHHKPENGPYAPSVRRLTRREWRSIKETGVVPYSNAIALMVVPPSNKDPITGRRPAPSMFSDPPVSGMPALHPDPLPLCEMLHVLNQDVSANSRKVPQHNILPASRVPLYNGATMFPDLAQRAYLHSQLCRALVWESRKRPLAQGSGKDNLTVMEVSSDEKASHTFLLSSDQSIARSGDMAGVAIALWRVRMYEGGGWDHENTWAPDPPKHEWRSERYKLGSHAIHNV